MGYDVHVIFPQWFRVEQETTRQNNATLIKAIWIDDIILPALRATCDKNTLARQPTSFAHACSISKVKGEKYPNWNGRPLPIKESIPTTSLVGLWDEVLRNANTRATQPEQTRWENPMLFISAHNLKRFTRGNRLKRQPKLFVNTSAIDSIGRPT